MKPNRWIVTVLFAMLVVWVAHTLVAGLGTRPSPQIIGFEAGAIGDLALPAETVDAEFEAAGRSMRRANAIGRVFAVTDDVLAWASFLATTVIALTLAAYGRPGASEGIEGPRTLPRPLRRLLPMLAALAAACTGASNMSTAQSAEWYDKADEKYQAIVNARRELSDAETAAEQQVVLDGLAKVSGR